MESFTKISPLLGDVAVIVADRSLNLALAGLLFSAVALGIAHLVRKSHPALQNVALMACLVGLLLLPLAIPIQNGLGFTLTRIAVPTVAEKGLDHSSTAVVANPEEAMIPLTALARIPAVQQSGEKEKSILSAVQPIDVTVAITLVWIAGFLVVMTRRLVGTVRLKHFESKLPKVTEQEIHDIWQSLVGNDHKNVTLLQGPKGTSPMTFGILSPSVVLPSDLSDQLSAKELRAVLAHELAHIKNRDALLGLIQASIAALYWWNPLVHVLLRRLTLLREMMSDSAASSYLNPAAYASSLLRLAQRTVTSPPAANQAYGVLLNQSRHPLEQRFRMLTRHYSKTKNQSVTMKQTIAIYSAAIAATFLCSAIHTSFAQEEEALPEIGAAKTTEIAGNIAPPEDDVVAQKQDELIDMLQQQIRSLQLQVEQLRRQSKAESRPSVVGELRETSVSSEEAKPAIRSIRSTSVQKRKVTKREPSLLIEGPDGEGRIEIDADGILKIDGPDGESIRIDTNSEIAKSFAGVLDAALKTAAQEMERELKANATDF